MKKLVAILALLAFAATGQEAPRFIIDPAFSATAVSALETWRQVVYPVLMEVSDPYCKPEFVTIKKNTIVGGSIGGTCDNPVIGITDSAGSSTDTNWHLLMSHEFAHLHNVGMGVWPWDDGLFFEEARAEAVAHLTIQKLARKDARFKLATRVWEADQFRNLSWSIASGSIGSMTASVKTAFQTYAVGGGTLEQIANKLWNGSLKPLDQVLKERQPPKRAQLLSILDELSAQKTMDGLPPSAIYLKSPANIVNSMWFAGGGPGQGELGWQGRVFGIIQSTSINWRTQQVASSQVAPNLEILLFFKIIYANRRPLLTLSITDLEMLDGTIHWELVDSSGRKVKEETRQFYGGDWSFTDNYSAEPEGLYRLSACIVADDGGCDARFTDTAWLFKLNSFWTRGKTIVMLNGPEFNAFAPEPKILDDGGARNIARYPGLLVFDGASRDIKLNAFGRTRTISPDLGGEFSRVAYLTERAQPFAWYVGNAATGKFGPVAPGSLAIVTGWGFTRGESREFTPPLNSTACEAQVWMNAGGNLRPIPIKSCAFDRLVVQIPPDTPEGDAAFAVALAEGASQIINQNIIRTAPGILMESTANPAQPKIYFAGGARVEKLGLAGKLVTPETPAQSGDILSLYAVGLGPTDPPIPDGQPAPEAANTLFAPSVLLGGASCPILYSGLEPGQVGVYRVDFILCAPQGTETLLPIKLTVNGNDSETVNLSVTAPAPSASSSSKNEEG